MKDSLTKSKDDGKQSISNDSVNKQPETVNTDFEDNSPEAIQMREFQSKVDSNEEMQGLSNYQDKIGTGTTETPLPNKPNKTGIPDKLKASVEQLSGFSLDDVKVHYNSDKPAQLQAYAYAKGNDIYVGPGQEEHLAHEVWHVVQQKGGKVKPTIQLKGEVPVNDDKGLEKEADAMGAKAMQNKSTNQEQSLEKSKGKPVVQRVVDTDLVDRFKELLKLKEVTVVEVPNSGKITMDTKFGDYPKENVYNIDAIKDKSVLDVNYPPEMAKNLRTDKGFVESKAHDIVDMSGGGGYMHTLNIAMYNEGTKNAERAILHEMGHAKQNELLNANVETANQIILEYHNVLLHENLFVDEEEGKGQKKRTQYGQVVKVSEKSKGKTWKDFQGHATAEENKLASTNKTLIKGILKVLDADKTIEDEVKENLVIEYFNKVG